MSLNRLISVTTGEEYSLNSEGRKTWAIFLTNEHLQAAFDLKTKAEPEKVIAIHIERDEFANEELGSDAGWFFYIKEKTDLKSLGVTSIPWYLCVEGNQIVYSSKFFPSQRLEGARDRSSEATFAEIHTRRIDLNPSLPLNDKEDEPIIPKIRQSCECKEVILELQNKVIDLEENNRKKDREILKLKKIVSSFQDKQEKNENLISSNTRSKSLKKQKIIDEKKLEEYRNTQIEDRVQNLVTNRNELFYKEKPEILNISVERSNLPRFKQSSYKSRSSSKINTSNYSLTPSSRHTGKLFDEFASKNNLWIAGLNQSSNFFKSKRRVHILEKNYQLPRVRMIKTENMSNFQNIY